MDFVRSSLSCPPSPCKLHVFSIFRLLYFLQRSSSGPCYLILSSSQFPIFITPKLLNSPPLCLSPSAAFSSTTLLSFILFSNSVTRPPLPFSSLSFHHRLVLCLLYTLTNPFFHPHLLSSGTITLSSRIFPSLLSLPPTTFCCCFSSSHLIPFVSPPAGTFSPQFALLSCPPCPSIHRSQILEDVLFIVTQAVQ